ncbi:MAG: GNAT family N-acetyltransferase [Robiginitomaculum sp.]
MTKTIIETERLILREVDPVADFEPWADCFSDQKTMTYIGGKTLSRAQCWRSMATVIGHQSIHGYSFMSVIEKSTGAWAGRIGHWNPEGWPEPEVGWTLHRDYWRKGYAQEAGRACIDYAFDNLGWKRVVHTIEVGNMASKNLAEKLGSKLLYKIDELPPFGKIDCWVYGQDKP